MPSPDDRRAGWLNITWTRPPHPCRACGRFVTRGRAPASNLEPTSPTFAVLCTDCSLKIDLGVDPDGSELPGWERERREQSNPDR